MKFSTLMNSYSKVKNLFAEIGENDAAYFIRKNDILSFGISPTKNELCNKVLEACIDKQSTSCEIFLFSQVLGKGPKIFRPEHIDFESLELTDLNLGFKDYVQPFPTIVIELPENYFKKKITFCPQNGTELAGDIMPAQHEPQIVILHHDPKLNLILCGVIFNSTLSVKVLCAPKADEEIENYLNTFFGASTFSDSLENTEEEWEIVKQTIKASLNYALLIDEFGVKSPRPDSEYHYGRLQHFLKVAKKKGNQEWSAEYT